VRVKQRVKMEKEIKLEEIDERREREREEKTKCTDTMTLRKMKNSGAKSATICRTLSKAFC
jgi:hypothetical protein